MMQYKNSVEKIENDLKNFSLIDNIKAYLVSNKIECVKYNHSLESEVQNFDSFNATIQLSGDHKRLNIINKKPIPNDLYVLESDPKEVEKHKLINKIYELEEEIKGN